METRYPYPLLNPPTFRWRRPDPLPGGSQSARVDPMSG